MGDSVYMLKVCCLTVVKPISRCVRIACCGLMITSLLQVVNSLYQVDCQDFLSTSWVQGVSTAYSKSANIKLHQV